MGFPVFIRISSYSTCIAWIWSCLGGNCPHRGLNRIPERLDWASNSSRRYLNIQQPSGMFIMTLLSMTNVKRHYETPAGNVKALDGINFQIDEGERVLLLGPSGSGKTTLLNCLSALDSPTDGSYSFMGSEVPRGNSEEMTSFRRENIGYVFQFFNLLQDLTVIENISLIQELAGNKDKSRAEELLRLVGLHSERDRFPGEISGGQQQRVAIARSIAKRPTLLLGDELTGNLDTETSDKVMQVLVEACEKENITAVLVTHDESLIVYATRVIRIDSGRIVSDEKTVSSEKAMIS